jgi:MoxR-like ATPase
MKQKLQALLADMNKGLVDRDQALKAALLTVLTGENLLLLGPPGTAKSLVSRRIAQHLGDNDGTATEAGPSRHFEYLLTKFSTPEEIFGPLSISELKADRFHRNTAGYLPGTRLAFLDEIFKASSSILNALLTILNERIFHNGNQVERVALRSLIAASNEVPTHQEELAALYDRFLMRIFVAPVQEEHLHLLFNPVGEDHQVNVTLTQDDLHAVDAATRQVTIPDTVGIAIREIWAAHKEAFKEDRREYLSDRRLVKLLKLLRVSAVTNERDAVDLSDLLLLQHCIWNHPDNIAKTRELVTSTLKKHSRMVPVDTGVNEAPAPKKNMQPRGRIKGFSGSGTELDPILINTAEDLLNMDDPDISEKSLYFLQTADIDISSVNHWPSFEFNGHYNGNGKKIVNSNIIKYVKGFYNIFGF